MTIKPFRHSTNFQPSGNTGTNLLPWLMWELKPVESHVQIMQRGGGVIPFIPVSPYLVDVSLLLSGCVGYVELFHIIHNPHVLAFFSLSLRMQIFNWGWIELPLTQKRMHHLRCLSIKALSHITWEGLGGVDAGSGGASLACPRLVWGLLHRRAGGKSRHTFFFLKFINAFPPCSGTSNLRQLSIETILNRSTPPKTVRPHTIDLWGFRNKIIWQLTSEGQSWGSLLSCWMWVWPGSAQTQAQSGGRFSVCYPRQQSCWWHGPGGESGWPLLLTQMEERVQTPANRNQVRPSTHHTKAPGHLSGETASCSFH